MTLSDNALDLWKFLIFWTAMVLFFALICLVLIVPVIPTEMKINYHVSMDNNTFEAVKSINWTMIQNVSGGMK